MPHLAPPALTLPTEQLAARQRQRRGLPLPRLWPVHVARQQQQQQPRRHSPDGRSHGSRSHSHSHSHSHSPARRSPAPVQQRKPTFLTPAFSESEWDSSLAQRRAERAAKASYAEGVWEEAVVPWIREEARRQRQQVGTRLADERWQRRQRGIDARYAASIRRMHAVRAQVGREREQGRLVYIQDHVRRQNTVLTALSLSMEERGLVGLHTLNGVSACVMGVVDDQGCNPPLPYKQKKAAVAEAEGMGN
eukprot:COSAG01_NODE_9791_length_2343_cov_1.417558_4_plen_249_part_00